jgi:signal transduction histidine kinase
VIPIGFDDAWFKAKGWPGLVGTGSVAVASWLYWCRMQWNKNERRRQRRFEAETEAYARLDVRPPADGDMREFSRRVCRTVAEKSTFSRTALLVRDAEGGLYVSGSVGMERATIAALHAWGEGIVQAERGGHGEPVVGMRIGQKSFAMVLEEADSDGNCRVIVIPLRTTAGKMVAALTVCAERMMSVQRREIDKALYPLEILAAKIGRAIENATLAERLLRAEKLAGIGLLAGGVAHALNNPLTAVLGFAELIAGTSDEQRVKTDAEMIAREALKMRETIDLLLEFGRPPSCGDQVVDVMALVRELVKECQEKLENRGVRLIVEGEEDISVVSGSKARLRQVLEHLLNNAAQSVASAEPVQAEGHVIRLSTSCDRSSVHLIVSDTGTGFHEPTQIFDPFYVSHASHSGGLGLSICQGIVREHGGEINAFNLYPRGATVVVELPAYEKVPGKNKDLLQEIVQKVSS